MQPQPSTSVFEKRTVRLAVPDRYSKDALLEVTDLVQRLFLANFQDRSARIARDHLVNVRKLPEWLIEEEGFGYLGGGARTVVTYLVKQGIDLEAAAEAGVVSRSAYAVRQSFELAHNASPANDAELLDFFLSHCAGRPEFYVDYPPCLLADGRRRFGHWLTIPIRLKTESGNLGIAGFQYRSMRPANQISPKQGRYMSPRNSPLLRWSDTLIGLAEESETLEQSKYVVICEGKFDQVAVRAAVRSLPEDQRPAVVALGGVQARGWSYSDDPRERAGVLAHIATERATFFLDWDRAGIDAVFRLGPLLSSLGTHVSVASIADVGDVALASNAKDPSELYALGGPESILRVLKAARLRGLATFAVNCIEREGLDAPHSGQLWHRLKHLDRLLPILHALPSSVRPRAIYRVAQTLALPTSVIERELEQHAPFVNRSSPGARR